MSVKRAEGQITQAEATSRGWGAVTYTGKSVAYWLNDPSFTPAHQRIIELLRQIATVIEMPDHYKQIPQAVARIEGLFMPYVWRRTFVNKHGDRLIGFPVSASSSAVEDVELLTADCINGLALQGLATGIRQCRHCSQWFFTTRVKKKFWCNEKCRKLWLKHDPRKKEERREYARNYYRNVLSPNAPHNKNRKRAIRRRAA